MNKDINDYNNSIVKNKKLFSLSQLNTNYNTSFDSDYTSNSQLINNNICEILDKNGWNAIHYSSYYGYYEILDFILNKFNNKSNINIINYEGWNALSLAVYKQHKKNNRKIVSLLLFKADFTIKDKNNKIAIEYTHDKNIIKLISKIVTKKIDKLDANSDSYQKLNNFINEYKHLLITKNIPKDGKNKKYSFLNTLNNIPVKPPILFGAIKKLEGLFKSRKKIYIEIDPIKGLLRTFKTFEDYPNNPLEIIHLTDVVQCIKADDLINHNKVGNFP
jgi:ankyrin repeat protein